jgi:cytochrome c biogenesis protein CcmG/thiol:disulfide interchange protein DsbE
MTRYLLPLGVFIALVLVLGVGLGLNPRLVPSLHAPEQTLSRTNFAGKVSLLNAWATWCVECRREHPLLVAIAQEGKVPVYGLNYKDRRPEALQWLQRLGNPYVASGFDADGRVGLDLGVYGLPETFLIDEQGMIVHKHIGPIDRDVWENEFVPVIERLKSGKG